MNIIKTERQVQNVNALENQNTSKTESHQPTKTIRDEKMINAMKQIINFFTKKDS